MAEDGIDSQPSNDHLPFDLKVWVRTIGRKKKGVFGLGYVGRSLLMSSSQPSKCSIDDVNVLRSQIHALNEPLHK